MTDGTPQTAPPEELVAAQARIQELEQELEAAKRVELITPEEQTRRWGAELLERLENS
jgi:hypothetical protein